MVDATVRSAVVRVATGQRLHYIESGDPAGNPVLFLHGWPDSSFSFSRVMALLPRRLRAIAVDHRGFGDSNKPESGYSIPELAADAIGLLDALGISRATLVGHSFGSFIARHSAIAHPSRVERLVLIGTAFAASNQTTQDLQRATRDLPDPIPLGFARDFQASTLYHPVPPEFFDRCIVEALKLPPRLWRLTMDALVAYDDVQQLGGIEAPTLLLWGDHDALFSREDQDRCLAALPGARLIVYEETGHCPNWERPELVAADIAAFVEVPAEAGSDT
jgi:pimeloyl-ACP methyl ester carboxylesterase